MKRKSSQLDSMEERGGVLPLIEKATKTTDKEINPRLLKAIKTSLRSSDSEIHLAVKALMQNMNTKHSQVRYLTLLIIDQLFMRSKLFRSLFVINFDQFLTLSIGFRPNFPLPDPPNIASILRSKAIEFLDKWNTSFGVHYRQVRLGYHYLKTTLNLPFPQQVQRAQPPSQREIRSRELLLSKFETLSENLYHIKNEINETVDEIKECLDILRTKDGKEEFQFENGVDEGEEEEYYYKGNNALREIRIAALEEGEKVHENNENTVIFDALRELYKVLVTKHFVTVREWISVLERVEPVDTRFRDSALKEFIDVHNGLKAVRNMCEQAGCVLTNRQEEEDLWEEGKIETSDNVASSVPNETTHGGLAATTSVVGGDEKMNKARDKGKVSNGDRDESHLTPVRKKLLAEAPVMTWGSFLDNWGINRDCLANQRGLELEGHWGRVDYDAVIPAEKIAELNVQATLYKEEHVEIQPCLAPLRKGGLCQRRDLKVCPFHGPVVPRDGQGNPIRKAPSENPIQKAQSRDDKTLDVDNEVVVEQLAKQAVKNVRERDKEEIQKRENDKRLLKRAKLAKVREHNEEVFHKVALASTTEGFREYAETAARNGPCQKKKEPTLASMLQKKKSAKDRLAERLLNARARDATTRQLTVGEDEKYREAFPNQW